MPFSDHVTLRNLRCAMHNIGVFIKGGTGNEEMGNGEIWKRRNGLEMVVKSVCSTVLEPSKAT